MRLRIAAACAALGLWAGLAHAQTSGMPIDTNSLIVQPSQAAANLAAQTIQIAGTTAANSASQNGFVKVFNSLFRKSTPTVTQPGGLPLPTLFPSTQYKSYNTPVMPTTMPFNR
jgi:hypothetical protein